MSFCSCNSIIIAAISKLLHTGKNIKASDLTNKKCILLNAYYIHMFVNLLTFIRWETKIEKSTKLKVNPNGAGGTFFSEGYFSMKKGVWIELIN